MSLGFCDARNEQTPLRERIRERISGDKGQQTKYEEPMSNCPDSVGLQQIGASTLEEFDRRVANIPKDLCAPFYHEAGRLETELLTIYKFVAMGARNEQDLSAVAASWGLMVEMCDDAALRLGELDKQHPSCGADIYFDRMLDLRSKCERLKEMHH